MRLIWKCTQQISSSETIHGLNFLKKQRILMLLLPNLLKKKGYTLCISIHLFIALFPLIF